MTHIVLAPDAMADLDRFIDHMARFAVTDVPDRIAEIIAAIDVLAHSSSIGRPVKAGRRELIVGRGSRAYVVLYRHVPEIDTAFVLALRSQRESGFKRKARG